MNIILVQRGYKVINYKGVHTIEIKDGDFLSIVCEGELKRIDSDFSWASKSIDKIDKSIGIDSFRIEVE